MSAHDLPAGAVSAAAGSPKVLIAEDEAPLRTLLARELGRRGFRVTAVADGKAAADALEKEDFDVLLLDVCMPERSGLEVLRLSRAAAPPPEAILLTGQGTIATAVEAMKLGAFDFVSKPCRLEVIEALLRAAATKRAAVRDGLHQRRREDHGREPWPTVWDSAAMKELHATLERVAEGAVPVLLLGETGAGKEIVAREIHRLSPRREHPFVDVNCGAIQDTLLESELFGHEKGAFTGADTSRPGLMEAADGGTLLLDEVGELPATLQVKLLRALESMSFYRVGGRQQISVDVRLVAATNKDLAREVEAGRFRADLFYRINAVTLRVPPLRERRADIRGLAEGFLRAVDPQRTIDPEVLPLLEAYAWPGNVRELRHVVERATLLSRHRTLRASDLPGEIAPHGEPAVRGPVPAAPGPPQADDGSVSSQGGAAPAKPAEGRSLRDLERERIVQVLESVRWNRSRAAEILGISPRTLYRRIKSYGLDRD
jgi:DNA-binding NtrC family response regulator